MKKDRKVRTNVFIAVDVWELVQRIAKDSGVSAGRWVRDAISEKLIRDGFGPPSGRAVKS